MHDGTEVLTRRQPRRPRRRNCNRSPSRERTRMKATTRSITPPSTTSPSRITAHNQTREQHKNHSAFNGKLSSHCNRAVLCSQRAQNCATTTPCDVCMHKLCTEREGVYVCEIWCTGGDLFYIICMYVCMHPCVLLCVLLKGISRRVVV